MKSFFYTMVALSKCRSFKHRKVKIVSNNFMRNDRYGPFTLFHGLGFLLMLKKLGAGDRYRVIAFLRTVGDGVYEMFCQPTFLEYNIGMNMRDIPHVAELGYNNIFRMELERE